MELEDAPFTLSLLNDSARHRYMGGRAIRTIRGARDYILGGPMERHAQRGFGFDVVERKEDGCPIGVCGLAKRDFLDDVDIGYAFLPQYGGQGYAIEAARGVMAHARSLGLKRIVATVRPDNTASIRVLEKLGLRLDRTLRAPDTGRELHLFAIEMD